MDFVLLIFLPIVAAFFVPFFFKKLKKIHTGWFVLVVPIALFIYYLRFIELTMKGESATSDPTELRSSGFAFHC